MMNDPVRILERLSMVAPLGICFWDAVTNSIVADGLRVTAYPLSIQDAKQFRALEIRHGLEVTAYPLSILSAERGVQGLPNRSGVYVLQNLPGMRDVEHGAGDSEFWANFPPKRPFVVEVVDKGWRFQPFLLSVDLPEKDIFKFECAPGSPPSPPDTGLQMVPLYSAPSRPVPGGMAVLRASLLDPSTGTPAAWALLEAYVAGRSFVHAQGFADEKGRIALIFPYPEPIDFADDPESPVSLAAGPPLTEQYWSVQLQAMYTPLTDTSPVAALPIMPDLCTILAQAPAKLWMDKAQTQQLTEVQLEFGQEKIVRSFDSTPKKPISNLYITPAA